jgi:hypothetical protein
MKGLEGAALQGAGFTDRDIWDIPAGTGFSISRTACATGMRPNSVHHRTRAISET